MTYTVPENISEIRRQAWMTRRANYGPSGHAASYSRGSGPNHPKMLALIIRLHAEGELSEGQVAKATDLHRIEIRRLADDYVNSAHAPAPVVERT